MGNRGREKAWVAAQVKEADSQITQRRLVLFLGGRGGGGRIGQARILSV
jgi:hypothetical protein